MAAPGENSLCVLEYDTRKSVVTVQRAFRAKHSSETLPRDLADLKARIIAAVKNIDAPMLTCVWQELEYRIDVCPVNRGTHINISSCKKKNSSVFLWLWKIPLR